MKQTLYRIYWFFSSQIGIDFIKLLKFPRGLFFFILDFFKFRSKYSGKYKFKPCLHDKFDESGATRSEYFWQDLLIAQDIFSDNPQKHLDIGSRIDGFVSNVASFMNLEVFDIRPLDVKIPNVTFTQIDLMSCDEISKFFQLYSSVSCLHTLEHFGLGRYGDLIDMTGYSKGFKNISSLVKTDGILYFSTPIGKEIIEFNANRIFDPNTILDLAKDNGFEVIKMLTISDGFNIKTIDLNDFENEIEFLSNQRYNLGIFTFKKLS